MYVSKVRKPWKVIIADALCTKQHTIITISWIGPEYSLNWTVKRSQIRWRSRRTRMFYFVMAPLGHICSLFPHYISASVLSCSFERTVPFGHMLPRIWGESRHQGDNGSSLTGLLSLCNAAEQSSCRSRSLITPRVKVKEQQRDETRKQTSMSPSGPPASATLSDYMSDLGFVGPIFAFL